MDCNSLGQNTGVVSLSLLQGIFPTHGSNPGLPHWRRLLRVPFTARISNQSILKEISPEYSLEELMLKLLYFGHLMRRADSLEKTLMLGGMGAGGEGDGRGWDGWMASPTRCTWVQVNSGSRWWTGRPGVLQFVGSQRVRHDWVTELNWRSYIILLDYNILKFSFSRKI